MQQIFNGKPRGTNFLWVLIDGHLFIAVIMSPQETNFRSDLICGHLEPALLPAFSQFNSNMFLHIKY